MHSIQISTRVETDDALVSIDIPQLAYAKDSAEKKMINRIRSDAEIVHRFLSVVTIMFDLEFLHNLLSGKPTHDSLLNYSRVES